MRETNISTTLSDALLRSNISKAKTDTLKSEPTPTSSNQSSSSMAKPVVPTSKRNDISYLFLPTDLMFNKSELFSQPPVWGTQPFETSADAVTSTVDVLTLPEAPEASKALKKWISGDKSHSKHYGTDITFQRVKTFFFAPWDAEIINATSTYSGSMGFNLAITPIDPLYNRKVIIHVMHLADLKVKNKAKVKKGDRLGTVSSTGTASEGVHAHISVTYSTVAIKKFDSPDALVRSKNLDFTIIPIHLLIKDFSYSTEKYYLNLSHYKTVYGLTLVRAWKNAAISTMKFGSAFQLTQMMDLSLADVGPAASGPQAPGNIFTALSDPKFWEYIRPKVEKMLETGMMFSPMGRVSVLGKF